MTHSTEKLAVIVPAAGVGKRMQAACPKQYLRIDGRTILEHTVNRLLSHPLIDKVVLSLSESDEYIQESDLFNHPDVERVNGGKERVDSVLAGLVSLDSKTYPWVLVHDAARPCVTHQDISTLISAVYRKNIGGILAAPVRDTMKRSNAELTILATEERELLWHALTPQMYRTQQLIAAIKTGLANSANITDESSAIELAGFESQIVEASSENIKITHPDDLAFAEFILQKQQRTQ